MASSSNPWVQTRPGGKEQLAPEQQSLAVFEAVGPVEPQPGLAPPDTVDRLPRRPAPRRARLVWVGTHGGAGESTLAALLEHTAAGGHAWPAQPFDRSAAELPVVLVARTHLTGLLSAQTAALEWAAGEVPGLQLLGLVLIPDASGRLPRALRDLARIVGGGVPRTWQLPWVEEWRTTTTPRAEQSPAAGRRVLSDLSRLLPERPPLHLTTDGTPR